MTKFRLYWCRYCKRKRRFYVWKKTKCQCSQGHKFNDPLYPE